MPCINDVINATPVEVDDGMSDYRQQRDALTAKFGGLLPIADGEIHKVEIAQGGELPDGRVAVRITMLCASMDQIALMAAPNHRMKAVLFEDRRGKNDAKETHQRRPSGASDQETRRLPSEEPSSPDGPG